MRDKVNKLLQKNSLSFRNTPGYKAHFLGRNSMLDLDGDRDNDSKKEYPKLAAGLATAQFQQTSGIFSHKDKSTQILSKEDSSGFMLSQLEKSVKNLRADGHSHEDIGKMTQAVSTEIYNGPVNTSSSHMAGLSEYIEQNAGNYDSINGLMAENSGINASDVPNHIEEARTKSFLTLGVKKQDFFGDMFSMITGSNDVDTMDPDSKEVVKDFAETTMRLSGLGDHMLEKGKSSDIQYAINLKCS